MWMLTLIKIASKFYKTKAQDMADTSMATNLCPLFVVGFKW